MKPKILLLDIETAPDVVYTWGVYQANAIEVKEHWYILCFAWQWLHKGKVNVLGLNDYASYKSGNDCEDQLLADLHNLLDEADIVVAHNGADFDVKKVNSRFIAHGFRPPRPYKVVDTKRDLKRVTKFSSNKLNWLSKNLGIGSKTEEHQDFKMWKGCMEGDPRMWKRMKNYNKHDIELLCELYNAISPWISQPTAGAWIGDQVCPNPACGSKNLTRKGLARTKTRVYQQYKCKDCGSWGRAVTSERDQKATVVKA